jgi:predicted anti-sigma-YlaC factor YlaD
MIAPDCAAARERAPDLAVGMLDGAERAEVLEHVHACPSCQAYVSELTGVADELVHLAPEIEPPAGFGTRVVASMQRPKRLRRRWVAALAAAVAAAAIVSIVAVRVIDAERGPVQAVAPTVARTPMVGANGLRVGEVVTATGDATALAVTVDYAVEDGRYDVVLRSRDDSTVLGTMEIADGKGEWSGRVTDTHRSTSSLDLVDRQGTPVCSAELGPV